jgi:UDP-N-acetylglucosamine:LPS N-acetylglucosamine transferase
MNVQDFIKRVRRLLMDSEEQKRIQESLKQLMPEDAAPKIADLVIELVESRNKV